MTAFSSILMKVYGFLRGFLNGSLHISSVFCGFPISPQYYSDYKYSMIICICTFRAEIQANIKF